MLCPFLWNRKRAGQGPVLSHRIQLPNRIQIRLGEKKFKTFSAAYKNKFSIRWSPLKMSFETRPWVPWTSIPKPILISLSLSSVTLQNTPGPKYVCAILELMSSNGSSEQNYQRERFRSYAVCCHLPPNTWTFLLTCFQRQPACFFFHPSYWDSPMLRRRRWWEHASQGYKLHLFWHRGNKI